MQQHVKDLAKYAAGAALKLALVLLAGAITSLTVAIMGFIWVIFKQGTTLGGGHAGAGFAIFINFIFHPISAVLWLIAGIILPIVYFSLANKIVLKSLIYKILHHKGESMIYPLMDKLLNEFRQKQPSTIKATTDYSLKKLKLMESIKHGNGNALLKRVVMFGLDKVKLNDVELNREGRDFYEVVKIATVQQLQQISRPTWWPLIIVMLLQWLGLYAIKLLPI